MRRKPGAKQSHGEKVIKDIRRATRKQYSAEEKIGVAFDGLKGEHRVAELFRREGLLRVCIMAGSRNSLRLARSASRAIRRVLRHLPRSKIRGG